MIRRLLCGVALVACAGIYAFAASERATVILTNGDRESGTLVGYDPNSFVNLRTDSGQVQNYPINQVAIIDFTGGGNPPANEVQSLPNTGGHVVVLKNTSVGQGRFESLTGDTVNWRYDNGGEDHFPENRIARIYMNPQAARSVALGTGGAVATSGVQPGAVQVQANQQWTPTGITVQAGERVAFQASGEVSFGQGADQKSGPDGNGSLRNPQYPVPAMTVGGLIGRVGNSAPFPIGSNSQGITMPASGQLMLGVNDNQLADNSGFFNVTITRLGR
jgi:hypothetical protein